MSTFLNWRGSLSFCHQQRWLFFLVNMDHCSSTLSLDETHDNQNVTLYHTPSTATLYGLVLRRAADERINFASKWILFKLIAFAPSKPIEFNRINIISWRIFVYKFVHNTKKCLLFSMQFVYNFAVFLKFELMFRLNEFGKLSHICTNYSEQLHHDLERRLKSESVERYDYHRFKRICFFSCAKFLKNQFNLTPKKY